MKAVQQSLEKLPACAERIAQALASAGQTLLAEGQGSAGDAASAAVALKDGLAGVAASIARLPGLLNPAPILAQCTEALELTFAELKQLGQDTADISQRLAPLTGQVGEVAAACQEGVKAVTSLPQALLGLAPSPEPHFKALQALPQRGQRLAQRALGARDLLVRHGQGVGDLAARMAQAPAQAQAALQDSARALQLEVLGELDGLKLGLREEVDGILADMGGVRGAGCAMFEDARVLVQERAQVLLEPLLKVVDLVEAAREALAAAADDVQARFDEADALLERMVERVREPVAMARAQFEAVGQRIEELAAETDELLSQALAPLDTLQERVDVCAQALGDVVEVVGQEVVEVQGVLAELDALGDEGKAFVQALPERFEPQVRQAIDDAVALIEDIQGRIPGFVAQAESALSAADSELTQADALCTNAIEVCTRYQMKVPPLMAARLLFVGVKGAIPGVRSSITTARAAVKQAGQTASGLLDQAQVLVQALHPVLDQALQMLQVAIDQLVVLVEQMQQALREASVALEQVEPTLAQGVERSVEALRGVLAQVQEAAQTCVTQLQIQPVAQSLREQLDALLERTFGALDERVGASLGPMQSMLARGRALAAEPVPLLDGHLADLSQLLADAHAQAQEPVGQLDALIVQGREQWEALCDQADAQAAQLGEQAVGLVDEAIARVEALMPGARPPAEPEPADEDTGAAAGDDASAPGGDAQLRAQVQEALDALDAQADGEGLLGEQVLARWESVSAGADDIASAWTKAPETEAPDAPDGSLSGWNVQAQGDTARLAGSLQEAADQTQSQSDGLDTAVQQARAEVQAGTAAIQTVDTVAGEVQADFDRMRTQAESAADEAAAAQEPLAAQLEEVQAKAQAVTQPSDEALAQARPMGVAEIEAAQAQAQAAAEAEQGAGQAIADAQSQVNAAAADAQARTQAIKDQAQAALAAAQAQVAQVQAQVDAQRQDVIKAEAIVDAEVVKHGGESLLAARAAAAEEKAAQESAANEKAVQEKAVQEKAAEEKAAEEKAAEVAAEGADALATAAPASKAQDRPAESGSEDAAQESGRVAAEGGPRASARTEPGGSEAAASDDPNADDTSNAAREAPAAPSTTETLAQEPATQEATQEAAGQVSGAPPEAGASSQPSPQESGTDASDVSREVDAEQAPDSPPPSQDAGAALQAAGDVARRGRQRVAQGARLDKGAGQAWAAGEPPDAGMEATLDPQALASADEGQPQAAAKEPVRSTPEVAPQEPGSIARPEPQMGAPSDLEGKQLLPEGGSGLKLPEAEDALVPDPTAADAAQPPPDLAAPAVRKRSAFSAANVGEQVGEQVGEPLSAELAEEETLAGAVQAPQSLRSDAALDGPEGESAASAVAAAQPSPTARPQAAASKPDGMPPEAGKAALGASAAPTKPDQATPDSAMP